VKFKRFLICCSEISKRNTFQWYLSFNAGVHSYYFLIHIAEINKKKPADYIPSSHFTDPSTADIFWRLPAYLSFI